MDQYLYLPGKRTKHLCGAADLRVSKNHVVSAFVNVGLVGEKDLNEIMTKTKYTNK